MAALAALPQSGRQVALAQGRAIIDPARDDRTGIAEVVFGSHKSAEQIVTLMHALATPERGALATRVDASKAVAAQRLDPGLAYVEAARALRLPAQGARPPRGRIVVVSAGTSDESVAAEAHVTAEFLGAEVERVTDVGVAGLDRLLARIPLMATADVVIAVAGMEGALPSVLAGLLAVPLIAVPTSVGYGVTSGGWAALVSMLGSCAPGIAVVNIDNGFGAAAAAMKIVQAAERRAAAVVRAALAPSVGPAAATSTGDVRGPS